MEKQRRGAHGEKLAENYLLQQGYITLKKNARFGRDEIDLIMRDGETIVFVEVKARSSARYGLAREAVTKSKQQHIIRAARQYFYNLGEEKSARFDVVEVDLNTNAITLIKDAFSS